MKKFCLALISFVVFGSTYAQVSSDIDKGRMPSPLVSKVKPTAAMPSVNAKSSLWSSDFSNQNDWTIGNSASNTANWVISNAPYFWWSNNSALASSSGGYVASFNSGAYATADNQIENNAWIQTASPINCSGEIGIEVTFEQFYSKWTSKTIVEVSSDGGQSWTDFEVNSAMDGNEETSNPNLVEVNISSAAGGEAAVLIRVLFLSNAVSDGGTDNTAGVAYDYGWIVDDFEVNTLPDNDVALLDAWHANIETGFEYSQVPLTQVREMISGVVIQNQGSMHQNIDVECTVTGDSGFIDSWTINHTSTFGTTDTIFFQTGFTPTAVDHYEITFSIPADADPSNDSIDAMPLDITDFVMAHDYGPDNIYGWDPTSSNLDIVDMASASHSWGNIFQMENDEIIHGVGVNFATGTSEWLNVRIRVREIAQSGNIQDPLIANNYIDYSVPPGVIGNGITNIPFDVSSNLVAGKMYIIDVMKVDTATVDKALFIGGSEFDSEDDDFSTVGFGLYGGQGAPANYYLNWGFAPTIRANFSQTLSLNEASSAEIKIFPNPSNGIVSITSNTSEEMTIEVRDLSGKLILASTMNETTSIDLSNVKNGMYLIKIFNENNATIERIVIQ